MYLCRKPAVWQLFKLGSLASTAVLLLSSCDAPGPSLPHGKTEAVTVEPLMEAPAPFDGSSTIAVGPDRAASRMPGHRHPRKGVITAGDIDDTLNLAAFQRYLRKAARNSGLPKARLERPVLARLTGPLGQSAPGVRFTLRRPGAADPFYSGHSGVDGAITVFPTIFGARDLNGVELRSFARGQQGDAHVTHLKSGQKRQTVRLPFADGMAPDFLDLAFVVDTTGSMGDELAWLTRELRHIVRSARRSAPGVDVRYGLVVYRDQGDDYVVRSYGFTRSQSQMVSWLRSQRATGGGDYPEAAGRALQAASDLGWRRGRGERLMFHIADAPPHDQDARTFLNAAGVAARKNVQIFGLGASGVGPEAEVLMRQAAVQTGGRYLFLTDDSGIGDAHAEPTISCYRVTKLNSLMIRVLRSELSGHRIEAEGDQIIREVGSYSAGRCRN